MKLIAILLLLILTSCSSEPDKSKKEKPEQKKEVAEEKTKHWEYQGETGPEHWAEIEGNSSCSGEHQSPINISEIDWIVGNKTINFNGSNYNYVKFTHIESVTNNGHSIQYNFDSKENSVEFNGNIYQLTQFHFHSPAEHTFNGIRFPLESHLVHYNKEINEYVVIAHFIKEGIENNDIQFLENFLPLEIGETKIINKEYCFSEALATTETSGYAYYKGSLTTPPCTENVNWLISDSPNVVSHDQIKILQDLMPHNNYRDVQELNGRKVYKL